MFKFLFNLFKRKPREIKLGIALGSGGAKGYAELGVLRAFEDSGISFDYFAGTSIGSIVGAFSADGYSSTDIFEMLKKINFAKITSALMIQMDTSGLNKVIDNYIGSKNIEELKKPFRAIATHFISGEEKVFCSGSVANALCASSAYPPFFKPVEIEGEKYIDGAFSNSVPADVVKEMGADYVVGVDLSTREAKPGFLTRMFPTYKGKVEEPWKAGYDNAEVMIHPDLSGYKPISFKSANEMYDIGYSSALAMIPQIKADIERLKNTKPKKKSKG